MPDTLTAHVQCVDGIKNAGIEIPAEWLAVRARFAEVDATGEVMLGRLIDATLHGGGDLPSLFSAAVAESIWEHSDRVREPLRHHTVGRLQELYRPHARANYDILASRFNAAAKALKNCAAAIDIEAAADEVIRLDAKQQRCWHQALEHCAVLNAVLEPLCCAALLCGSPGEPAGTAFDAPTMLIPLTISNASDLHRRQLWRSWEDFVPAEAPPIEPMTTQNMREPEQPDPGRTGRWGKLLAIGAQIRAYPHPEQIELYRRPEPRGVRFEFGARGVHGVPFDPEDNHDRGPAVGALTGQSEEFAP